jgi:hypothetical protein
MSDAPILDIAALYPPPSPAQFLARYFPLRALELALERATYRGETAAAALFEQAIRLRS